ncbi:MAG: MgtC/SapB family protein [Anaerolineae bacterium]|nr:MgtC/SapB family protein [Anaerolineae bacterium]
MANLLNVEPWWRFAVAILIGALIGLEREFIMQHTDRRDFAGIRTFSLVGLVGAVVAFLFPDYGPLLAAVAFGGLLLLSAVSYAWAIWLAKRQQGITTEVALILVFLLGMMVVGDTSEIAIALAVIVSLLLSMKDLLHRFVKQMSDEDLYATLQFGLVSAVILPLLPNRAIDPLGVFNPFQVWLLVVLVSGIGFGGYVLMKIFGAEQGINITGLLGGIASSTATTLSFATRSKETPSLSSYFAQAILLASLVMFPRVVIEVLAVHPPLVRLIIIPLIAMVIAGLVVFYILWRQPKEQDTQADQAVKLANPLKLTTAIGFGLVFAVVLIVVRVAQDQFGDAGVYAASFITGLTDVDAITLSVSELAKFGQLDTDVAAMAVIIGSVMNTLSKGVIAYSVGSKELRKTIVWAFGVMVLAGAISGTVMLLVG